MERTRFLGTRASGRWGTLWSLASTSLVLVAACSGSDRAEGVGGTSFQPPSEQAPCTAGQTRACGIELGSHAGYVDCVKGTQTCLDDRSWSSCVANGAKFTALAPPPKTGTEGPKLGARSVGGLATVCTDNPCNPYCKSYDDLPDSGITSEASVAASSGTTITIDDVRPGAIPGGFIGKGSIDAWCLPSATAAQRAAACQFDQHCGKQPDGTDGCVPFLPGEKGSCTGIDITSPPVCSPTDTSTYRNLGICNRGAVDLTSNILCMGYPGNKPHYPNDDPGLGTAVLDTSTTTTPINATNPLKPGECRTFTVPNANFASMGTESIMCNVPNAVGALTTVESVPSSVSSSGWSNPLDATNDADSSASATFTLTRAGVSQNASATANVSGWTNPNDLVGATDSTYAQTSFADTTSAYATATADVSSSCSSAGCSNWSSINSSGGAMVASAAAQLQVGLGNRIRAALTPDDVSSVVINGYSFPTVPSTATIGSLTLQVKWSSDSNKCSGIVNIYKSDGTTLVGTYARLNARFGDPSNAASDVTDTVSITPLVALTGADLPGLKVEVRASRTGTGAGTEFFTVDYLGLAASYASPPQSATLDATYPVFSLAPGANIEGFLVTAVWNVDTANTQNELGITPVLAGGTVLTEATASLPGSYVAGSAVTSRRAWTGTFSASDLAAGFKLRVRGTRKTGSPNPTFELGVDSLNVTVYTTTGPSTPTLDFTDFGFTIPSTATNVQLATLVRYKASPATSDDWLAVDSFAGARLLNTGAANAPASFTEFQVGSTAIVTPTDLADGTFKVRLTGTRLMPGTGTTTHSVDYVKAVVSYQGDVGGHVDECNGSNNWTVSKANPGILCESSTSVSYPPWTVTRVFAGTCPAGSKPNWSRFGYDTLTPTGTRVDFRFRAFAPDSSGNCTALSPAIADPPAPFATAQLSPDTQRCDLSAAPTSSCPVDLVTRLGSDATLPCLQMDARGLPAISPPAAPTLNSWRVTYDCVPSE